MNKPSQSNSSNGRTSRRLPNRAWNVWKRAWMTSASSAAHSRPAPPRHNGLNTINNAIATAQAAVQAADAQVAQVVTLAQLSQAVATAAQKSALAHRDLDKLNQFTTEIEREPMDRAAPGWRR
jgi:hypothetical protein